MTGAWHIFDPDGIIRITVDLRSYGQPHCEYDFRSERAERDAESIVAALNARDGL
jgi:hypothetical protein